MIPNRNRDSCATSQRAGIEGLAKDPTRHRKFQKRQRCIDSHEVFSRDCEIIIRGAAVSMWGAYPSTHRYDIAVMYRGLMGWGGHSQSGTSDYQETLVSRTHLRPIRVVFPVWPQLTFLQQSDTTPSKRPAQRVVVVVVMTTR